MVHLSAVIAGRDRELAAVTNFTTQVDGPAASMVIDGVVGIGKTTLWSYGIEKATESGVVVRSCRCTEADSAWAFSGLGDLFDAIPATVFAALPDVQRIALSAALLMANPSPSVPSDRLVGVAVLSVLRLLAEGAPQLLAIDDLQWLDSASRAVLTFALRRLGNEPIRVLATQRTTPTESEGPARSCLGLAGTGVHVGSVSATAMQQIINGTTSFTVSRPTLARLHHATAGNPMLALEMANALHRRGFEPAPDEPLPMPTDIRVLVAERMNGLSAPARDVVVLCSALNHPSVSTLAKLVADPSSLPRDLVELSRAEVMEADDTRLRFVHPLLSSVPYEALSNEERRVLHRRIAGAVDDPEEHARHVALGTDGVDDVVAAALEVAAEHARHRGGAAVAAELAALAAGRTPADLHEDLLRRRLVAARYAFHVGDPAGARAIADLAVDEEAPGPARVDGLLLLAMMDYWTTGSPAAAQRCETALAESGDDRRLQARCHAALADLAPFEAPLLLEHARRAVELISEDKHPPPGLLANALKNVAYHEFRLGHGLRTTTLDRALAAEDDGDPLPVLERVRMYTGMLCRFAGEFDMARRELTAMLASAYDEGDESALPTIYGHLALLECWVGDFPLALQHVDKGNEFTVLTGIASPSVSAAHALAEAALGNIDEARRIGAAAVADDEANDDDGDVGCDLRSLGFVELAAGDPAAAAAHLLRALEIVDQLGVLEPAILRMHADAVEALVGLGRIAEADVLTAHLEQSQHASSLWARTMAHRCRGLLAAAGGDLPTAEAALLASLDLHRPLGMQFEEARTRLLLGSVLRRAGRRRDARAALEAAARSFDRLGTPHFATRARDEIARLGGRLPTSSALTATEARVAELVARGRTNTEVAAELFVSVRTVESHLSRIYRKLGLRSRTELARIPIDHQTG
jgi:DNA-binding CsgD family transcriptional regulator/tetratricopeptide (TPR) repeat protein